MLRVYKKLRIKQRKTLFLHNYFLLIRHIYLLGYDLFIYSLVPIATVPYGQSFDT